MKTWTSAWRDALVSGSSASIASTAVLAATGKAETGHAFAPTNAVSHWYHGASATRRNGPSWRYTALGYITHHTASVFWATLYEKLFGERRARASAPVALAQAGAVAALACFVDYRLTPARFMPGYEQRLSRRALAAVYAAFAAGLALGGALLVAAEHEAHARKGARVA